jgi:Protein of unknown function, DUF417
VLGDQFPGGGLVVDRQRDDLGADLREAAGGAVERAELGVAVRAPRPAVEQDYFEPQPLIAHSPIFSWLYSILGVRTFAAVLGSLEIVAALLIAIRPLSPRISVIGSAMGVLLFLSTLSFLFTTPGVTAASGFPVLSVLPGQFLLKDLVLVSASLWTLGDSLGAALPWRSAHGGGERT